MKRFFHKLWPLLTVPLAQIAAYYGSRLLAGDAVRLRFGLPLDGKIPLCAPFILFYMLAFVQWFFGYLLLIREERQLRYRYCAAHLVAEGLCLVIFTLLPTEMVRPEMAGEGFLTELIHWIYANDAPTNLFPSIHCMQSWFCLRMALEMKRTPRWYAPFTVVLSLLVLASTVLVKQHVLLDIPAGVLVAEAGLFLARKFHLEKIFDKGETA